MMNKKIYSTRRFGREIKYRIRWEEYEQQIIPRSQSTTSKTASTRPYGCFIIYSFKTSPRFYVLGRKIKYRVRWHYATLQLCYKCHMFSSKKTNLHFYVH